MAAPAPEPARAPDHGGARHPVARVWGLAVDGLAAAGTVLIVVLMGIICSDVIARNVFGASLPLISELGALTLVMIVYLQLATAIRHDRLARADLFFGVLRERRPRVAAFLGSLFDLVGAVALGVIAWATIGVLQRDVAAGQFIGVTGVMTLPTWPFRAMIVLGMTVAVVQFAVQAATGFAGAVGRRGR